MELKSMNVVFPDPCVIGANSPYGNECIYLLKNLCDHVQYVSRHEYNVLDHANKAVIEDDPSMTQVVMYHEEMERVSESIACHVADLADRIVETHGVGIVLVSFAGYSSPIGVLLKRYLKEKHECDIPHYSIAIDEHGVDGHALDHIRNWHVLKKPVFVMGWGGEPLLSECLKDSITKYNNLNGTAIPDTAYMLVNPVYQDNVMVSKDLYLPYVGLGPFGCGLVSRPVLHTQSLSASGFASAVVYHGQEGSDLSTDFVDTVSSYFKTDGWMDMHQGKMCCYHAIADSVSSVHTQVAKHYPMIGIHGMTNMVFGINAVADRARVLETMSIITNSEGDRAGIDIIMDFIENKNICMGNGVFHQIKCMAVL